MLSSHNPVHPAYCDLCSTVTTLGVGGDAILRFVFVALDDFSFINVLPNMFQ